MCWHGLCREPSVLSLGSASADSMSQVESKPGFDSQHHRKEAVRKEGGWRKPLVRRRAGSPLSDTKVSCSSVPYPIASISGLVCYHDLPRPTVASSFI